MFLSNHFQLQAVRQSNFFKFTSHRWNIRRCLSRIWFVHTFIDRHLEQVKILKGFHLTALSSPVNRVLMNIASPTQYFSERWTIEFRSEMLSINRSHVSLSRNRILNKNSIFLTSLLHMITFFQLQTLKKEAFSFCWKFQDRETCFYAEFDRSFFPELLGSRGKIQ